MCQECANYVPRVPRPYTPAAGFDRGNAAEFRRIYGLQPLTSMERALIAPNRLYVEVLQLFATIAASAAAAGGGGGSSAAARARVGGQLAFRGHTIAIPHDGPQVATTLPRQDAPIQVVFVGTHRPSPAALKAAIKTRVQSAKVLQWLRALKAIGHVALNGVEVIDDEAAVYR